MAIKPMEFFFECVGSLHALTNTAFQLGVYNAVWAVVPYALTLTAFSLAAGFAVAYLLEYYVVLPAGIILLGLGGTAWSKKFATNYVKVLIAVGLKLLCLQVLLYVATPYIKIIGKELSDASYVAREGFFPHAFSFAGFAAIIFISVKTIPQYAANLVAGASFGRANWFEPASFPALPPVNGYQGVSPQRPDGSSDMKSISGTMSTMSTSGFAGVQPTGAVSSSLGARDSSAARENARFEGTGFGNYAHDVIFGDDLFAGGQDMRQTSNFSSSAGLINLTGAMSDGVSGSASTSGARGTMSGQRTSDDMPNAGLSGTFSGGWVPGAMTQGGAPDAMSGGGVSDAISRGESPYTLSGDGSPNSILSGEIPESFSGGWVPDASPRGGTPDAMARGGVSDATPRGGTPDARPAGGMPDARPAPTSQDMRNAIKESLNNNGQ